MSFNPEMLSNKEISKSQILPETFITVITELVFLHLHPPDLLQHLDTVQLVEHHHADPHTLPKLRLPIQNWHYSTVLPIVTSHLPCTVHVYSTTTVLYSTLWQLLDMLDYIPQRTGWTGNI